MPSSTLRPGFAPCPSPGPPARPAPEEAATALASTALASTALASTALASTALAGLRLVEVPDAAPPYDGQVHGACGPVRAADVEPAMSPGPGENARPAGAPAAGTRDLGAPAGGPVTALALVIVEALAGVRPERQLLPLTTDRVRARIRGLTPLLRCDQRPRVLRILASQPAPRVVEMTVVATFGSRSRALALRFEHAAARPAAPGRATRPARWRCTAIEAG